MQENLMKTFKCLVRFCGLGGWHEEIKLFSCDLLPLPLDGARISYRLKNMACSRVFKRGECHSFILYLWESPWFLSKKSVLRKSSVLWNGFMVISVSLFVCILFLIFNSQEWKIQQIFNANENSNILSVSQCLVWSWKQAAQCSITKCWK